MTTSIFTLPLYTFMLKDGSGAVFLRAGPDLFLPIFTSIENALLYAERDGMECLLVELATRDNVASYIESPPSRAPEKKVAFRLMVDPIDSDTGEYLVYERRQILGAIR
jgi:hypothetical protein